MKKELLKRVASVFSLTLVLISAGCSSKALNENAEDKELLPVVAKEEQAICEAGG